MPLWVRTIGQTDSVDHLRSGLVVGQHVRLVEPVTSGPGQVWRAFDQLTDREVAVKLLAGFPADNAAAHARFRLAMRTAADLSCAGIASVHDYGTLPAPEGLVMPYLIRELVPGRSLEARLGDGSLQVEEALAIVAAVADALAAAHRAGVVHGHLVPANVVLGPAGVRVTDFGLWALRDRLPPLDFRTGLSYAAPELAAGGPVTPATDMYSLGVVFAACLSGIAGGAGGGGAALGDLPDGPAAESLASLWAACLGASPRDRPSAAHAAVMSRQMIPARIGPQAGLGRDQGRAAGSGVAGAPGDTAGAPRELAGVPGGAAGHAGVQDAGADSRPRPSRRGSLLALSGIAAGAVAATMLLTQVLGSGPARPVAGATPTRQVAPTSSAPARRGPSPGVSPDSTSSAPAPSGPASSSPAASSPASSGPSATGPASPLPGDGTGEKSPRRVISEIWDTITSAQVAGQLRTDVAVDFENLITPEKDDIDGGDTSGVGVFVTTFKQHMASRIQDGSLPLATAQTLNSELKTLLRCVNGAS
jgi:eukaryotic-like serine/threonine-protein kinase